MNKVIKKAKAGDLFIGPEGVFMLCQYGAHKDEVVLIELSTGLCWNSHDNGTGNEAAMNRLDSSKEWIPILPGNCVSVCQK